MTKKPLKLYLLPNGNAVLLFEDKVISTRNLISLLLERLEKDGIDPESVNISVMMEGKLVTIIPYRTTSGWDYSIKQE